MKRNRHQIPVKIAYIGGGSTNWAIKLIADLALDDRLVAKVRLFDLNEVAARRNAKIGNGLASRSDCTPAQYEVSDSLEQALSGADIVVISILPGTLGDMGNDLAIPESYGIPQSVGDTVGPGGFVRALRAIPMMVEIAEAVRRYAPAAFVCNLTNPMSVLTGVLYSTFAEINAWGECHEVTKIRNLIAKIAAEEFEGQQIIFSDVDVNVLGINHFTFVDRVSVGGVDMLPKYDAFVAAHASNGWPENNPDADAEHNKYFGSRNLISFDMYKRFGVIAAAGDRHLAEFLPKKTYLTDTSKWGISLTPIAFRKKEQANKQEHLDEIASGNSLLQPVRSDEALTDQIYALMSGKSFISNVNLPNVGQVNNLPLGAIVETNALFSGLGISPVFAGGIPLSLHAIMNDHASRQMALVEAAISRDYNQLLTLFQSDPLVAELSQGQGKNMFDEMILATSHLVPELLKVAS